MNHLHVHLTNYLKLRRGLGFKLHSAEMSLRSFIRFAEAKRVRFVTTKLALQWATQPTNAKRVQSGSRLATVRRFAEYLSTVDPRTEVPSPKLLPYHIRRRPPQLYRDEDVRRLVDVAYQIAPGIPIKGPTLGTLLGLLATTGMRVSEALKLDCGDVDWDREQLTIRLAKGNKTRLAPLHASTIAALRRYASTRDTIYPKRRNPAFFVWDGGGRLGYDSVNRWFLLVACQTGLRKPGDQRGPRVHDLRHHFAIQTMLQWYTFRLLIGFAHRHLKKLPTTLAMQDLDASFVCRFLDHLEKDRGVSARSRNVRLAAVHSFFHYVALQEPALGGLAQRVLAIKSKRHIKRPIDFLTRTEAEALLAAPNQQTWLGRRDHMLLLLALQTGLRLSEIIGLRCQDVALDSGPHVRCTGKGRKSRCVPLRKDTVTMLRAWLCERNAQPDTPLFPNLRGKPLSRDGVQYVLAKHVAAARQHCPSLQSKRVSPHVLRHSTAMELLQSGVDRSVISLWLGHERMDTTQIYLHASLELKEKALAKTEPFYGRPPRYRPPDQLMAFLQSL